MQIYNVLKGEHVRIGKLFRKLEDTTSHQPEERRLLIAQIRRHLEALLAVEEDSLYPLLEIHPRTGDQTRRSRQENQELRKAVDELGQAAVDAPRCEYLIETLDSLFRRHVEGEEHELYVLAQQVVATEQAELLGERAETALKVRRQPVEV